MRKSFVYVLIIVLTGLIIYSNTFHSPFVFDDIEYMIINFDSQAGINLLNISDLRYITYLTFAMNYAIGGLNTLGYHLFNISIHALNGILVYMLVILTFGTPFFRIPGTPDNKGEKVFALFAGLFFVSHPIQTQAVTYLYQRSASLATFFYLLSVVTYVKAGLSTVQKSVSPEEQRGKSSHRTSALLLYCTSVLSAVLAMKTKEIAFTLPFIIFIYEAAFFCPAQGWDKKRIFRLLPFFLTLIIIPLSIISPALVTHPPEEFESEGFRKHQMMNLSADAETTLRRHEYLFTQFRVIVTYIRLLFFPVNQNLLYEYPVFGSFSNPVVFMSFIFLLSIFTFALYLFRASRRHKILRLTAFGIFWFFITLSVESSIIPLKRDVIFEHRVYLPSVGVILAFIPALFHFSRRSSFRTLNAACAIIVVALSVSTYMRNNVWRDDVTLWKDVVKKSPSDVKARNNLANAYLAKGNPDEAIREYLTAIKLYPDYAEIHYNLAQAYSAKGMIGEAIQAYLNTIKLKPAFAEAHNDLGIVYFNLGRLNEAVEEYSTAIKLRPTHSKAYNNLGNAYMTFGRIDEAIANYHAALKLSPASAGTHFNLGFAYMQKGLKKEAITEFEAALEIQPNLMQARMNLELLKR